MAPPPALIPRKPGERVKTDRRDGLSLARLDRAVRDLSRAREDLKILDQQLRQRLNGFLLRHSRIYEGKRLWTPAILAPRR